MALLERINSMRQTGMSDTQIFEALKEEGVSAKETSEALSQLKIKSAIATNDEELQPSIMAQHQEPPPIYQQQAQEQYAPQQNYQPYSQEYAPDSQAYGSDQQYAQTDQAYYAPAMDLETIREIAKQEAEEAVKKVKEETEELVKFKSELSFEIQNIDNRLQRVEGLMQEIQTSIIRKMGEYGESVNSIAEDLKATQDSFSKMLNPLMDNRKETHETKEHHETQHENKEHHEHQHEKEKANSRTEKHGVEHFLR